MAEQERRLGPGRRRDGGQVLILPLRRERLGVAAVTPAAAVVGDDGEALSEVLGRNKRPAGAERAHADDERRTGAGPVVGDDGTVGRLHGLHAPSPFGSIRPDDRAARNSSATTGRGPRG